MEALLDSGAELNAILGKAMLAAGLQLLRKTDPYDLNVVNGAKLPGQGQVTYKVLNVLLDIQGHTERTTLDIIGLANHNIVLGLPWLQKHNPRINWKNCTLLLDRCDCARTIDPTHRTLQVVDEKTINSIASTKTRQNGTRAVARADTEGSPVQTTTSKENSTPPDILTDYAKWTHLFKDEKTELALPEH